MRRFEGGIARLPPSDGQRPTAAPSGRAGRRRVPRAQPLRARGVARRARRRYSQLACRSEIWVGTGGLFPCGAHAPPASPHLAGSATAPPLHPPRAPRRSPPSEPVRIGTCLLISGVRNTVRNAGKPGPTLEHANGRRRRRVSTFSSIMADAPHRGAGRAQPRAGASGLPLCVGGRSREGVEGGACTNAGGRARGRRLRDARLAAIQHRGARRRDVRAPLARAAADAPSPLPRALRQPSHKRPSHRLRCSVGAARHARGPRRARDRVPPGGTCGVPPRSRPLGGPELPVAGLGVPRATVRARAVTHGPAGTGGGACARLRSRRHAQMCAGEISREIRDEISDRGD